MNDADRQASSSAEGSGDDLFLDASADESLPFAIGDDGEYHGDNESIGDPLFADAEVDNTTSQRDTSAGNDVPPRSQNDPANVVAASWKEDDHVDDVVDNPDEFSIGGDEDENESSNAEKEDGRVSDTPFSSSVNIETKISNSQMSPSPLMSPGHFDDVDVGAEDTSEDVRMGASSEPTPSSDIESTPLDNSSPIQVPTSTATKKKSIRPVPTQQPDDKSRTVPETGSSESWEPVKDEATMNNAIQYEILPGLFAHLSDDAVIGFYDVDSYAQSDDDCQHFEVLVNAKKVSLGCGSFLLGKDISAGDGYFITGCDVTLRGQLERPRDARDAWDIVVHDLNISIASGLELDALAERAHVVSFLEKFGYMPTVSSSDKSTKPKPRLPARRMTKDEWQQFLRNAQEDKRAKDSNAADENEGVDSWSHAEKVSYRDPSTVDFLMPYAKVWEVSCKLSNEKSIDFPDCEGTAKCTLRTLLEYYFRSILNTVDEASAGNVELDGKNSVADLTSVKASIVGAAAGAAVLGPIGFLAGSYLGSQLGRKHSTTVVGATAGACLFGPVGLIAGACYGESTRNLSRDRPKAAFGRSERNSGGIAKAATKHVSSNKYEYAGTAGVVAGAAAGSVAGPIGMLTGAYLGSVSARKVTENASGAAAEISETEGRREYRFGDITRGLVARGKQARGADKEESYQLGDFTRGLFGGGKGK